MLLSCSKENEIPIDTKPLLSSRGSLEKFYTKPITNLTPYGASSGMIALDSMHLAYRSEESGVCWSTSPEPTLQNSNAKSSKDSYYYNLIVGRCPISYITRLEPNTKYYVRGYIKNYVSSDNTIQIPIVYADNTVEFTTPSAENLYVGKEYLGGYISGFFQRNDPRFESPTKPHGFIVYKGVSIGSGKWGCPNTLFSKFMYSEDKTTAIAFKCGLSTAAGLIYRFSKDNFNDWQLPSQSELFTIKAKLNDTGVITYNSTAWSRDEVNAWYASVCVFGGNPYPNTNKNTSNGAIPIRYF